MKEKNDELLTRGISSIYPSKEFLQSKIDKGEKPTIYLGIDPTGPTLHLGHTIPIKKLGELQKAGFKVVLLMGDFTAMIGDPTDKGTARKPLTHKQVMLNLKNYKKQASALISFKGKNAAQLKFNSKWLGKMNFEKIISLASQMTVQQMLERDMFDKRIKEGRPVFMHEFLYPLMQAYDSVAMDVDGEIGGNDQTFNMLCGRDMIKTMKGKEKFVITTKLLEDNSGKKMGKTEGNMAALSDTPEGMYGKIMSWADGLMFSGFELCTNVPMTEVSKIFKDLELNKINPRDLKMRLAKEIVTIYHGGKKAAQAEDDFVKTFQKNEIPENVETILVKTGAKLIDVFVENKIVSSKTEFRRLIDSGSITNLDLDQKISLPTEDAISGSYRVGKKRFIKIKAD